MGISVQVDDNPTSRPLGTKRVAVLTCGRSNQCTKGGQLACIEEPLWDSEETQSHRINHLPIHRWGTKARFYLDTVEVWRSSRHGPTT